MTGYYFSNGMLALFGAAFSWAISLGIEVFEAMFLETAITPPPGETIENWIHEFKLSQDLVIAAAVLIALLWHTLALFDSGRGGDRRLWWAVLWCASIISAGAICYFLLPETQDGAALAFLFGFLNGAVPYWLGTAWCTPSTHKYAPTGSILSRSLLRL